MNEEYRVGKVSYTITRFLTYARILDPCSKLATWDKSDNYYEKPDFNYQHILRFMDILFENQEQYLKWLYQKSNQVLERNPRALYYDCTNFYFECEKEDESVIDPVTKEVISGLRKFGVSKENRPNPIVEMGLIIDEKGIPLTMCIHPGNTNEQTTAIPLEKEVLNMLEGRKFIYCADAGLSSYNIRKFNSLGGRAFIVTQSIKKLSDILKQAVFNDYDYRLLSRSVRHRERHRIIAHFMICYSALLVDRLLENKLEELGMSISTEHLIETIKNLNVVNIHDVQYMALYDGSKALDGLNKLTGLNLDFAHYQPKELNKKNKKLL